MFESEVMEMVLIAFVLAVFLISIYSVLCGILVRGSLGPRFVLGDIGWKKVDYFWIVIGSLAILLQAFQLGTSLRAVALDAQKSIGASVAQHLNFVAAQLSDDKVCDQLTHEQCESFRMLRPSNITSTFVDVRVLLHHKVVDSVPINENNKFVLKRVEEFRNTFKDYDQQLLSVQVAQDKFDRYSSYIIYANFGSVVLLFLAVALRLAKVTGEIKLKSKSVVTASKQTLSSDELKEVRDGLATKVELTDLEDRLIKVVAVGNILKYSIWLLTLMTVVIFSMVIYFIFNR